MVLGVRKLLLGVGVAVITLIIILAGARGLKATLKAMLIGMLIVLVFAAMTVSICDVGTGRVNAPRSLATAVCAVMGTVTGMPVCGPVPQAPQVALPLRLWADGMAVMAGLLLWVVTVLFLLVPEQRGVRKHS